MLLKPGEKARNVLGLIYMEDVNDDYGAILQHLDSLQIPCACSCVHDRDTFTEGDIRKFVADRTDKDTGEVDKSVLDGLPTLGQHKKAHVHILLRMPGPKSGEDFTEMMAPLVYIAPNRWEKCNSPEASLRYFGHLDTPEKAQYGALSVKGFGGLDMSCLLKTSKTSNIEVLLQVMRHVDKYKVRHYNQLVRWAMETADLDIISCVAGRASFFAAFFKGQYDERQEKLAAEEGSKK